MAEKRIGSIDQDRANMNSATADDPAAGTHQLAAIVTDHHRFCDVVVFRIAMVAQSFLTDFQRGQEFNPRIPISDGGERIFKSGKCGFILFDGPTSHRGNDRQEAAIK